MGNSLSTGTDMPLAVALYRLSNTTPPSIADSDYHRSSLDLHMHDGLARGAKSRAASLSSRA